MKLHCLFISILFFSLPNVLFCHADSFFHERYQGIKKYLDQYTRPFTAIEVNPSEQQPFSLSIAHDYACTCLIFGSHDYTELVRRCAARKHDNLLIGFQQEPQRYYERLAQCEHFDVVIIPEVHTSWKKIDAQTFNRSTNLGDHTLLELIVGKNEKMPHEIFIGEKKLQLHAVVDYSNDKQAVLYLSYNSRRELYRRRWGAHPSEKRFYTITATFDSKTLKKRKIKEEIPWHHGINLNTFAKLHCLYPDKEQVAQEIRSFEGIPHGDLALGNIIIQGNTLLLIDWDRFKILYPSIEKIVAKFLRIVSSTKFK